MNLSVSKQWPDKMPSHLVGKPTNFKERILNSLLATYPIAARTIQRLPREFKFKPHTIREDKNNRWKPGMRIHFFEWLGKPYRSKQFKFATSYCKSAQAIEIVWHDADGCKYNMPSIYIDGRWLVVDEMKQLALNDGFDSLELFYAWFNSDFKGRIIHWTDLKY